MKEREMIQLQKLKRGAKEEVQGRGSDEEEVYQGESVKGLWSNGG